MTTDMFSVAGTLASAMAPTLPVVTTPRVPYVSPMPRPGSIHTRMQYQCDVNVLLAGRRRLSVEELDLLERYYDEGFSPEAFAAVILAGDAPRAGVPV
jgi:hypothetical protein